MIADMLFVAVFLSISLGIGKLVWSRLFGAPEGPIEVLEEGIFSISIGLGIIALLILILGVSGLLTFWAVLALLMLLFLAGFRAIKAYAATCASVAGPLVRSLRRSSFSLMFFPLVIITLIWLTLMSRIPPVFYDALVYHLGIPNQYIVQGAIFRMPYSMHSYHPFLIQNLFAVCLLLGGQGAPKSLVMILALLNAAGLSLCALRMTRRPFAWLAGIILLITPTMLIMGSLVNVDLGFSLYAILAFHALCMWSVTGKKGWLAAASLMTGFSLGTKYTAIIFCLGLGMLCMLFVFLTRKRLIRGAVTALLLFVVIAIVVGSGWYIKNLVWTHNPFYPQWADVWGSPGMSKERLDAFHGSAHGVSLSGRLPIDILTIPYDMLAHPGRFGVGGSIGLLVVLFIPLAFIPDRENPVWSLAAFYCAAYYLLWGFTFRMTRFAIPCFAILILLETNTLSRIVNRAGRMVRVLVISLLMAGLAYNLFYAAATMSRVYDPWRYLSGAETPDAYLSRAISSYPIFGFINEKLPSHARILFLGETISFYCVRDVISSTVFDINPIVPIVKDAGTPGEVRERLRGMGITHLLVNFPEIDRLEASFRTFDFTDRDRRMLMELVRSAAMLCRRGDIVLVAL
ncbi:MAG: ArnT family glycosyltransferase [bacterium]